MTHGIFLQELLQKNQHKKKGGGVVMEHAMKILLVEDDSDSRETLAKILTSKRCKCKVATAENYADAIAKIEEYHADPEMRFDVLLTDIILQEPTLGGDRLLKTVSKSWPEIAIVAISGANEKRKQCRELGAHTFLSKPLTVEDVLFALNHAVLSRNLQGDQQAKKH